MQLPVYVDLGLKRRIERVKEESMTDTPGELVVGFGSWQRDTSQPAEDIEANDNDTNSTLVGISEILATDNGSSAL